MFRRFVLAAACLLLSVQLGTADEKTKGKISIWLGYPETVDAFKLGQAEFKKKYPNVEVEILTFEGEDAVGGNQFNAHPKGLAQLSPPATRVHRAK